MFMNDSYLSFFNDDFIERLDQHTCQIIFNAIRILLLEFFILF